MVGEVNHVLKGLAGPMLKSVGTVGGHEVEEGTGLLDGGATHPLPQGTSDDIKNEAQATVELAHGATSWTFPQQVWSTWTDQQGKQLC